MSDIGNGACFLISRAGRPIILEVEIRSTGIDRFVREYNEWSNDTYTWADLAAEGHAMDMGEGKWGVEARVYVPLDHAFRNQMRRYGFRVESGHVRHRNTFRINKKDLFRELVRTHGLRIGYND